jgi:transcriptional regulator with XRE-family HTH domain
MTTAMTIIKNYTPKRKKHLSKDNSQSKLQLIIWSNIFHRRKYKWFSQTELAKKAEVTQSIISELENGDYNPSMEVLKKISDALCVEYEILNKQSLTWKMIEVVDYLSQKIDKIDTLKAMKLLYLIDYESLQKMSHKLIWLDYRRWSRWPFNREIYDAEKIFSEKKKNYSPIHCKTYLTLEKNELKFIDMIIEKFGHMKSADLMHYTYTTEPMEKCSVGWDERMWEKIL